MEGAMAAWGPAGQAMRRVRAVRRGLGVVLFTVPSMAAQAVLLSARGRGKVRFARVYWAGVTRLLGLRVRVVGAAAPGVAAGARPVVFAANHSSWLDIAVLGGVLHARFVAKAEVDGWPGVRTIARLGRTVFVSRRARDTAREREAMQAVLAGGDNLLLFPEGTSSDGSRVLPFRSAFFSVCEGEGAPLVQPVSVVYDRLGGMPAGRSSRALFAWYGDMELAPHFWRIGQEQGLRATVLLHPPLDPADFPNRKALAAHVGDLVADGAARLRQNRPVEEGGGAGFRLTRTPAGLAHSGTGRGERG